MMKMTGKAFAKKLFGARYERLPRTLLMDVIVFWGLYIAGFQVQVAASVRILMINAFTAGVIWQALSSRDNAVELKTYADVAAAAYSQRKYWYAGGLWAVAIVSAILFCGSRTWFGLLLLVNSFIAILILWKADGYAFYIKCVICLSGKADIGTNLTRFE